MEFGAGSPCRGLVLYGPKASTAVNQNGPWGYTDLHWPALIVLVTESQKKARAQTDAFALVLAHPGLAATTLSFHVILFLVIVQAYDAVRKWIL